MLPLTIFFLVFAFLACRCLYDLTIVKQFAIAGKNYTHQETISTGGLEAKEELIQIAWEGTLTVRTDADTGTFTMTSADHLITTGALVDIYWTNDDDTIGSRRGVIVGTVSTTSVPFDLGQGDDLPDAATVCQVALVNTYSTNFDGDDVAALVASADFASCTIVLKGSLINGPTALNFGTSSPVTVFTLPAQARVTNVRVQVVTAFNGTAPTVKVGISGTTAKYSDTGDSNLKVVGVYDKTVTTNADAGTNAIILTYAADSSSAGAAVVYITYRIEHLAIELPANAAYDWLGLGTNPIAGDDIDQILMSHNDITTERAVRVSASLDI